MGRQVRLQTRPARRKAAEVQVRQARQVRCADCPPDRGLLIVQRGLTASAALTAHWRDTHDS